MHARALSRRCSRLTVATAAVALFSAFGPSRVEAQLENVAGGVGGAAFGAVSGVYLTTAIYVAKARAGSFIYSLQDLARVRLETAPIIIGPIAGGALGATSPDRLGRTVVWGAGGFAAGAGLGYLAGRLLGDTDEETWAGAIIGSGVGLLAGTLVGALGGRDTDMAPMSAGVTLRGLGWLGGPR